MRPCVPRRCIGVIAKDNPPNQADMLFPRIGRVCPSRCSNVATIMPPLLLAASGDGLPSPHRRIFSSRRCIELAAAATVVVATVLTLVAATTTAATTATVLVAMTNENSNCHSGGGHRQQLIKAVLTTATATAVTAMVVATATTINW